MIGERIRKSDSLPDHGLFCEEREVHSGLGFTCVAAAHKKILKWIPGIHLFSNQ